MTIPRVIITVDPGGNSGGGGGVSPPPGPPATLAFFADVPSSIADTNGALTHWGIANILNGVPQVISDTVTGQVAIRTDDNVSISAAAGAADFVSNGDVTITLVWRTTQYNYASSSYPIFDTTEKGTKIGIQVLAREDYAFGDFRRIEVRFWNGASWTVLGPALGSQNAGHWIPLKWHVIIIRITGNTFDIRIDDRAVSVTPDTISYTPPGLSTGKLTFGEGPSDYQCLMLHREALSDEDASALATYLGLRFTADLIVPIGGDLRATPGPYSYVGFPGLVKAGSQLYCTIFLDATESEQPNRIDARRSFNLGRSWGSVTNVATSGPSNAYANVNVTVLRDGTWVGTSYEIAAASIQHLKFFKSTDAGVTWTITDVTPLGGAIWEGCSGFILEDAVIDGKLYWPVYTQETDDPPYYSIFAYVSTNSGTSWPTRHAIARGVTDTKYWAEPDFIYIGSSIYCIIRDAEPPNFLNPPNEAWQSVSNDSAVTWSAPVTTTVQADSAGQSLTQFPSGRLAWVYRPPGYRMAAVAHREPGAGIAAAWSNLSPSNNALWLDFAYNGRSIMSYAGMAVTGVGNHPTMPGIACIVWGSATISTLSDVVGRPNFYEWYLNFAMPGAALPLTATVPTTETQQIVATGAGGFVYAFTANPTNSSISASGLFTGGNTNGDSIFTVTDRNGQLLATCTYTVTGGGGGFVPPQPTHVFGHFDPSEAGSVTASGGLASAVTNLTGAASSLTQSSGGLKPAYGSDQVNGLNVLNFESAKVMGLTIPSGVDDVTVIMVVKSIAADSGYHGHMGSTDLSGPAFYIKNGLMAIYDYPSNGEVDAVTDSIANGSAHILCWRRVSGSWDFFVDATKTTTSGNPITGSNLPATQFFGATSATAGNPSGDWIGETYLYDVGLSDGEYAILQAHLKAKWGTP